MFPTQAIIDRNALRHNFNYAKQSLANAQPVPVIKSDAYGHGAAHVAQTLADCGCDKFAVFRVEEARKLRDDGILQQLWILLGALDREIDDALQMDNLKLAVWSKSNALKLNEKACKLNKTIQVHLKVDTGMGRIGVLPHEVPDFIDFINTLPALKLTGAFTHLACAANPHGAVTRKQQDNFRSIIDVLPNTCTERHASASCAIANKLFNDLPYARPGILSYGIAPEPDMNLPIIPAMTFKSRIISVKTLPRGATISYGATVTLQRNSKIAVVPVGYASGLPRTLTNTCNAIVRGHKVRNLGTICMDMTMFDVTDVPGCDTDDEVVLIGRQGNQEITAWDVATLAKTIPYDILCHIGLTQPRSYIN